MWLIHQQLNHVLKKKAKVILTAVINSPLGSKNFKIFMALPQELEGFFSFLCFG